MSDRRVRLPVAHTALLGLMRTAASGRAPEDLAALLREAKPERLAHCAQSNHVHTLIGPVLAQHKDLARSVPDDLVAFFTFMHQANAARNEKGRQQLEAIGHALEKARVPAVVLKGGGDILDPLHGNAASRFVGDLDILIPADQDTAAIASLAALGAQITDTDAPDRNWRGQDLPEHHLPAIIHDDWPFPVELHIGVGSARVARLLPAGDVFARSVPSGVAGLGLMHRDDRACHLIAHAHHHEGSVSLRAWFDWTALRPHTDVAEIARRLGAEGIQDTLAGFDWMGGYLLGRTDEIPAKAPIPALRRELRAFAGSTKRKAAYVPSVLINRLRGLVRSPEYRAYVLSNSLRPAWWRDMMRNHRSQIKRLR